MSATASSVLRSSLAAARAGSRDGLGQALDQCREFLLEVARGAIGPSLRTKGGASDLVQDTFLEAQRRFGQFDGKSTNQLRAWLRSLLQIRLGQVQAVLRAAPGRTTLRLDLRRGTEQG